MADEANVDVVVDDNAPFGPDGNPVVEEPAEPAAEPSEEPATEPEPAKEKPAVPEGYVPIAVVQEMREELRATRTRAEQTAQLLQEQNARAERIRLMHEQEEAANSAKSEDAALEASIVAKLGPQPDATEQPWEAREWQHQKDMMLMQARSDAKIERLAKAVEGRQTQDQGRQFEEQVRGLTAQFIQEHPDYEDAFKHVMDAEAKRGARMGLRGEKLNAHLEEVAKQVVEDALANRENPAARIYSAASEIYGWQPKPAAAAAAAPKTDTPAKKLETKAEGQRVRSMPAGGAQSEALPTLEEVAAMPFAEYQQKAKDPKFKSYVQELLRNA